MEIETRIERNFTEQELSEFLSSFVGEVNTQEVRAAIAKWINDRTSIVVEVTQ
jgi:hypothetical protein